MAQPHRAGHQFGNPKMRRKLERKQRQWAKLALAGKKTPKKAKAKKGKNAVKPAPPVPAYPCGPKKLTLGEAFPSPATTPRPRPCR